MAENIFTLVNSGNWFNMSDLCRLCGSVSDQFLPIYNDDEVADQNLIQIITEHMPMIQVSKDDALPVHVCYHCASTLVSWSEFCSIAINADKLMKSLLNSEISDMQEFCAEENPTEIMDKNDEVVHEADSNSEGTVTRNDSSVEDYEILSEDELIEGELSTDSESEDTLTKNNQNSVKDDEILTEGEKESRRFRELKRRKKLELRKLLLLYERACNEVIPLPEIIDKNDESADNSVEDDKIFQNDDKKKEAKKKECKQQKIEKVDCPQCEKTFAGEEYLKAHMQRMHETGPKKYKCNLCEQRFTRKSHLICHKRIHSGEKPFACDLCGKLFRQRGTLAKHRRLELGLENFVCQICSKSFTYRQVLRRHISAVHLKIRNYQCNICGSSFTENETLKNHLRSHTEERPFMCSFCPKTFKYKLGLRRHLLNHSKNLLE